MDIIDFLKPKFVLMENVVDIVKFADGILGYHAVGRLVSMSYQTRLGIMAAGSYGVPQCRLRVFLWGANTMMNLPQFPLPTHEVVGRGVVPVEFKDCIVGSDNDKSYKLEKSIFLGDAISDLPERFANVAFVVPDGGQEAARTIVLSSQWVHHWTKIPILVFDEGTFQIAGDNELTDLEETYGDIESDRRLMTHRSRFFSAIYQTLLKHDAVMLEFM
ncbi:DNA (cytosine-5)-methyltransferase CMT3-like [Bidens hawaiensis]|uniref:DNA (cytosine-5)-methyltransferase CMT3-like n=1 Tax=Bidens hawaiensis TaxID=980011 RepID=UPI00404A878E